MKIKKDSFHYKVVAVWSDCKPSTSLCLYFWQVVFLSVFLVTKMTIFGLVLVAVAAACLFFAGALIALPFGWLVSEVPPWYLSDSMVASANTVIWVLLLGGCGLSLLVFLGALVKNSWKMPELLKAYLKAKKEKVCPVLEFE